MDAYPLSWPASWPRISADKRKRANFNRSERQYGSGGGSWVKKHDLTVSDGVQRVLQQLRQFGVLEGDAIVSTNIPVRLDGLPRGDAKVPADPGVAVYWQRPDDSGTKVMAIDRYDRVADNLAAIAATLEAMRAIERHGGAQILDRAFTGFAALPAPGQIAARGWSEVMGFEPHQIVTLEVAKAQYRKLSALRHPDRGGTDAAMSELNWAWEQARQALGA